MINFTKSQNITDTSYFILTLSDGRQIFQDFDKTPKPCWTRIQQFLKESTNLKITGMQLIGRGKIFDLPAHQKGYFYGHKFVCIYPSKNKVELIGIGYYDSVNVNIRWFNKNNFKQSITETRSKEKAGFFLIENIDE